MFDDRSLVTADALAALRPTLRQPTIYTQRLVERLEFLPRGGQRWCRDLQILIPEVAGLSNQETHWFIISLGQFRRRRLPDFGVRDGAGKELNLLTRVQHGHCLADFTIDQYLDDGERDAVVEAAHRSPEGEVSSAYAAIYLPTFAMFTSVRTDLPAVAEARLRALLLKLGSGAESAERRAGRFMEDMKELSRVTQYLCWVQARPGAPVRVSATYTMPDPRRLAAPDPHRKSAPGRVARIRGAARVWRSEQYARLGLGPVPYDFLAPANDHAASYYFSMDPPPETSVAYLDWGIDNTIENRGRNDWSCAHESVHLHNGAELLPSAAEAQPRSAIPESKIRAFLRLDPSDHLQILFAAGLNLVFVWLAEAGRLNSEIGGTTAPWLAFTPALLLAYVAQQRRHYLASATKWVRAVIWVYLLLNIGFLVSITFDIAPSGSFADRHGLSDDVVSVLMASASIVIFWIFAFVGPFYDWFVQRAFRFVRWRGASDSGESSVHSYVRVSRWHGNLAMAMIVVSLAGMAVLLASGGGPHESKDPARGQASHHVLVAKPIP